MVHQSPIRNHIPAPDAAIPDKLYFRIGEVARLCDVPAYVLRFWESEFPQLRPNKGGSGQRLFRRRDVEMALRIRSLLYDEGYTIPGARQLLKGETKQREFQLPLVALDTAGTPSDSVAGPLRELRAGLRSLLDLLSRPQLAAAARSRRPAASAALSLRTQDLFDPSDTPDHIETECEHE